MITERIAETEEYEEEKGIIKALNFFKSHKKITLSIIVALFLCIASIVVTNLLHSSKAQKIKEAQIGKCYIKHRESYYLGEYYTEIYYFRNDGYCILELCYTDSAKQNLKELSGSLNEIEYNDYPVEISLFGEIRLHSTLIEINDQYDITFHNNNSMKLISLDEALEIEKVSKEQYKIVTCNHEYGTPRVLKRATCTSEGEEKLICKICKHEQINAIDKLPHNYKNKICTVCKEKQPAEKSDIKPNTWYTNSDGILHIQNCVVLSSSSVSQGRAMMVNYKAVCQHCHVVEEYSKLAGPEVNYEVKKIYNCDECGGETLVRLKIN